MVCFLGRGVGHDVGLDTRVGYGRGSKIAWSLAVAVCPRHSRPAKSLDGSAGLRHSMLAQVWLLASRQPKGLGKSMPKAVGGVAVSYQQATCARWQFRMGAEDDACCKMTFWSGSFAGHRICRDWWSQGEAWSFGFRTERTRLRMRVRVRHTVVAGLEVSQLGRQSTTIPGQR